MGTLCRSAEKLSTGAAQALHWFVHVSRLNEAKLPGAAGQAHGSRLRVGPRVLEFPLRHLVPGHAERLMGGGAEYLGPIGP